MNRSEDIFSRSNRLLIGRLLNREIAARYRGFLFGKAWLVVAPLLSLAVFTFVFSEVFAVRWDNVANSRQLALMLFAGLIVFQFFSETVTRSPGLILEEKAFVNKAVFPLPVLPVVAALGALANAAISFVLLLVVHVLLIGAVPATALFVPMIMAPLFVLTLGLTYLLSAMGVYLRDLKQVTPWLAQIAMFLGPVFYPLGSLPGWAQGWVMFNPVTIIIENVRAAMLFGQTPDLVGLWVYSLVAVAVFWIGMAAFRELRPGFADVV